MPRHYTRGRTGSKPRYVWVPARDVENAIASGLSQSTDLLAEYPNQALRETGPHMTIERIIGSLIVESQTNGSGGDFQMGITMAPPGGFGGAPNPVTELHDWMVWLSGMFSSGVNEQAAGVFQPDQTVYQFDVRTRRKLRSVGDEIRAEVNNSNSTSLLWSLNIRTLIRIGQG